MEDRSLSFFSIFLKFSSKLIFLKAVNYSLIHDLELYINVLRDEMGNYKGTQRKIKHVTLTSLSSLIYRYHSFKCYDSKKLRLLT